MEDEIQIPAAHPDLPEAVQQKWKTAYRNAYLASRASWQKAAQIAVEHGGNTNKETQWHRDGLLAANAILSTPKLSSYEQAMKLEDWHFVLRAPSSDGKTLRIVTRHGDAYTFPIPVPAA